MDAAQMHGGPLDSMALGQLRSIVSGTRPKTKQYDFPAEADCDSLRNEINEFFSYVEAPQVAENRAAWEEWSQLEREKRGEGAKAEQEMASGMLGLNLDAESSSGPKSGRAWTSLPSSVRRQTIETLLTTLEVKDPTVRVRASRALTYLLQGSFADTNGPGHQLHWILENARMVRMAGGLAEIFSACKLACWKHDYLGSLPDNLSAAESGSEPLMTPQLKAEYMEEINLELTLYFAQLYLLVETGREEEDWSDELMSLEPPLPIYLFSLVAALREKPAKGYPVKKLLLLLWKSLLASFGGMADVERCKKLARELEGLPPAYKPVVTKTTPLDMQSFQHDVQAKFPTYTADLPLDKLASAVLPIPPRRPANSGGTGGENDLPLQGNATPAPTPPASPKPNKQKYQTDQTRPFVFPYSASVQGGRLVPYSIEEAARLYQSHMHISLELWQMCKIREECIQDERGGQPPPPPPFQGEADADSDALFASLRGRGEPTAELLAELDNELDGKIKKLEGDHTLAVLDSARYVTSISRLCQVRADVRRLQRVDQLYWAVLPMMQSSVIVLLKLLLATVTAQMSTNSPHARAIADGVAPEDAPPPTLEDVDVARHREITSKAVGAILLMCLKWFKASHTLKFHYLSQLLVDSNCLLLILKMFGLQEVANSVKSIHEAEQFTFFRYCETFCGQNPRLPQPEDSVLLRPNPVESPHEQLAGGGGEDIEYVSDYSWRNFFSAIHFTRILQKLTKRRVHRILLLVQYKSSAILKRTLKVNHPQLQLYALKVIKSQVPFCGRKWRQSNMKAITAIYLNCRPDLRDEWLAGTDVDADVDDSLPQERALRSLLQYYNASRSGMPADHDVERDAPAPAAPAPADAHFFDSDVLPPVRRTAENTAGTLRYIPDDVVDGYLDSYEDILGQVFGDSDTAWARLGEILGESPEADTESVSSAADENQNEWEHLSPNEMKFLASGSPTSPRERTNSRPGSRSGSMSSPLRPVLPALAFGLDDLDDIAVEDDTAPFAPQPLAQPQPGGIDEVEHIFGT